MQLCGDAHLSNFGVFASPERELLFDLNDFDETLPGPFEYDVKRLAASFTIAARNNAFDPADVRKASREVGRAYRTAMAAFAELGTLDIWYARMSEADVRAGIEHVRSKIAAKEAKESRDVKRGKGGKVATVKKEDVQIRRSEQVLRKARSRTNLQALSKLTEVVDGRQRIVSQPPVLVPLRELEHGAGYDALDLEDIVRQVFGRYRGTLSDTRRLLLDDYVIVDVARKVVGVGSVGTRAFVVLLEGRDERDPLFLQVKEATRSVLEAHLPRSRYDNCGERVVQGQQLMQSASDIFLGWSAGVQTDRFYYWRQLRDMKGSADILRSDRGARGRLTSPEPLELALSGPGEAGSRGADRNRCVATARTMCDPVHIWANVTFRPSAVRARRPLPIGPGPAKTRGEPRAKHNNLASGDRCHRSARPGRKPGLLRPESARDRLHHRGGQRWRRLRLRGLLRPGDAGPGDGQ